jgi:hypothetical protein
LRKTLVKKMRIEIKGKNKPTDLSELSTNIDNLKQH